MIQRLRREFPGYHPVVEMARIAHDENEPAERRFAAHKEVATYVTPKLRAVDMNVNASIAIGVKEITDEEWKALSFLEHGKEDVGPGEIDGSA